MNLEILKNQIEKLRNMKYMKNIFKIIVESDEQYILNENGIFKWYFYTNGKIKN